MVNLVIVSHSQQLAEGVKELAEQMRFDKDPIPATLSITPPSVEDPAAKRPTGNRVRIAVANAGEEAEESFGTSAATIVDAIRSVWTDEGVLLLVDLGSAVLNAGLALELLPTEVSEKCVISNAPIVEGAVAAMIEASLGQTLWAVNQAAESANQLRKV